MATNIPTLPADHAFVVQFRAQTSRETLGYEGRVEHVASGQARRFSSWDELQRFITRVLKDMAEKSP